VVADGPARFGRQRYGVHRGRRDSRLAVISAPAAVHGGGRCAAPGRPCHAGRRRGFTCRLVPPWTWRCVAPSSLP